MRAKEGLMLYIANDGEVACGESPRHGGAYLASEVSRNPNKARIDTPIKSWLRVSEKDEEEFGLICEACEQQHNRQEKR